MLLSGGGLQPECDVIKASRFSSLAATAIIIIVRDLTHSCHNHYCRSLLLVASAARWKCAPRCCLVHHLFALCRDRASAWNESVYHQHAPRTHPFRGPHTSSAGWRFFLHSLYAAHVQGHSRFLCSLSRFSTQSVHGPSTAWTARWPVVARTLCE